MNKNTHLRILIFLFQKIHSHIYFFSLPRDTNKKIAPVPPIYVSPFTVALISGNNKVTNEYLWFLHNSLSVTVADMF